MIITMGALREGLSNFVNKIKSMLGRKKITEEKSADLFSTLTAPGEDASHTPSGYPYIENEHPQGPKEVSMVTHHEDTEPTAMAA